MPISAPIARPNRTAIFNASSLKTGSVPGSAKSKIFAWVLGSAPNSEAVPENNFDLVESETCTSRPMTDSHSMVRSPARSLASDDANQFVAETDGPH